MISEKRCETCDLWTHDSGDVTEVLGDEGYSFCGANHFDDIYKRAVTHKDAVCEKWRPEEEALAITDEEIAVAVSSGQLGIAEDDVIRTEEGVSFFDR